jgi:hypothetical protein
VSAAGRQARRRWSAVLAGVAVLAVLPAARAALPVPSSPISATALRAKIAASASLPYEGYAESTVDLGLPVLPDLQSVTRLFDGTTDQYVWYLSPHHWRADGITAAGEEDVYQVDNVTYQWNYSHNLLTRILGAQPARLPRSADLLPPALAERLIALASPADHFSRLPSARIAGVDAAGLRMVPASPDTTIGAIDIWADPADGLPVKVQILSRGVRRPALTASFLQVSQHRPAFSTVIPHHDSSVDVVTTRLPDLSRILTGGGRPPPWPGALAGLQRIAIPGGIPGVAAYGTGLTRFVLAPLPGGTGNQAVTAAAKAGAAVRLRYGTGVVIRTPLLTVLLFITSFHRHVLLFTGPVTPTLLEHAATDLIASFVRGR